MIASSKNTLYALILTGFMISCGQHTKSESTQATPKARPETIAVEEMQLSRKVTLPGELKPWNRVNIMARVNGYVNKVQADRGDKVAKGQTLAVLEAPELYERLNMLKSQVAESQARVIETESRLLASKLTYQRLLNTSQTKGAISANELDQSYAKLLADSALTTAARGASDASRAQLKAQQELINYLIVSAPFDGVIIERNISPGALVGASGTQPLFVLEDQTVLRLTVAIPENMSNAIPENSDVNFTVPASPGQVFTAHYARSAGSLQELNRSMPVEFDAPNPERHLKAGMYAEAQIPVVRHQPTQVVPASAIISTSEGNYVIMIEDNRAKWISIRRGNEIDGHAEIFGDIQTGDQIILHADPEIRDGMTL